MNYKHDSQGRFSKGWVKRAYYTTLAWIKWTLIRTAVIAAFGWTFYFGNLLQVFDNSRTVYAQNTATSTPLKMEMNGKTIEQLQEEVIAELSRYENSDHEAVPVIIDDNRAGTLPKKDKFSYGCMQYKNSTVQRHYKGIHGTDLTNLEAVLLALDCEKARELAREAIFGKLNAINEWSAATAKMKIKVEVIRELAN